MSGAPVTATRLAASRFGAAIRDPFSPHAFDAVKVLPWKSMVHLTYGALNNRAFALEPKIEALLEHLRSAFAVVTPGAIDK